MSEDTASSAPRAGDAPEVDLAGRAFLVSAIGGEPVLDGPAPELSFGADGRVSGRATVNRIMGPYEQTGGELRCGALAMTMMAGLPEAMHQEQRLVAALTGPLRVSSGAEPGTVVLGDPETGLLLTETTADPGPTP